MRMRWQRKSHVDWGATALEMFAGRRTEELHLALYEVDAQPGGRPVVEVEVAPTEPIDKVPQGSLVQVAGVPRPGHAVVILAEDLVLWPVYPATRALRPPRL